MTIKHGQSDTAMLRNLLEDDFNSNTVELPPSRPETEPTSICYPIAKSKIALVLGMVVD